MGHSHTAERPGAVRPKLSIRRGSLKDESDHGLRGNRLAFECRCPKTPFLQGIRDRFVEVLHTMEKFDVLDRSGRIHSRLNYDRSPSNAIGRIIWVSKRLDACGNVTAMAPRVRVVRRYNRGEILRRHSAGVAIIRRAVDKAYRHARRFRSAISGCWLKLPAAYRVLGGTEYRPRVAQSIDPTYFSIFAERDIQDEQPVDDNLVGDIGIVC